MLCVLELICMYMVILFYYISGQVGSILCLHLVLLTVLFLAWHSTALCHCTVRRFVAAMVGKILKQIKSPS